MILYCHSVTQLLLVFKRGSVDYLRDSEYFCLLGSITAYKVQKANFKLAGIPLPRIKGINFLEIFCNQVAVKRFVNEGVLHQLFSHFFRGVLPNRMLWRYQLATKFPLFPVHQKPPNPKDGNEGQHFAKPPNIYCKLSGEISRSDCVISNGDSYRNTWFENLVQRIRALADPETYTVYQLLPEDFHQNVWQAATEILVLGESKIQQFLSDTSAVVNEEREKLSQYLLANGKILLVINVTCSEGGGPTNLDSGKVTLGQLESCIRAQDLSLIPLDVSSKPFEGFHWTWDLYYPQSSTISRPLLALYIRGDAQEIYPAHTSKPSMIVVGLDDIETNPTLLSSALQGLGVCLASSASGLDPDSPTAMEPPKPSTFYGYLHPKNKLQQPYLELKKLLCNDAQDFIMGTCVEAFPEGFEWADYFCYLNTKILGLAPVWTDVLESSYTTCLGIQSRLPQKSGLVLISSIQTAGKGRRANLWISPRGMACFTMHFTLPISSQTSDELSCAHLLSWMQHIGSLSVVLTLRQLLAESVGIDWRSSSPDDDTPKDEQCQLSSLRLPGPQILIKWPNDVYLVEGIENNTSKGTQDSEVKSERIFSKLCGILTSGSGSSQSQISCLCGIGINVGNRKPTTSLHEVVRSTASLLGISIGSIKMPSPAAVIACTISHFERLILRLESKGLSGLNEVIKLYTSCWIHENQKVQILDTSASARGTHVDRSGPSAQLTIVGLDKFGFLRVVNHLGKEEILHPDGNSVDMLAGLVIPRQRPN